ncbi:DoxX family protein [Hymenobacter cellulosivorans]|uniref:DoxX family protein n=1 Tax=Hymenobacter cellulosivorans TaxID=2932249 RepID=A0ABY4FCT7_9BACT|nr:DoxX family protein [Hymenobacter cellulosivorans]UOQ54330.1 DoxX family protein [Hymenobacter cellulosivorans]
MKTTNILYWVSTGFFCAMMLMSGIINVLSTPEAVEGLQHLGYPAYLLPFLGVAKILGVLALLVPGFPHLREWAYAGFVFDLAGAMYSGLSVGDPVAQWLPIGVGFLIIAVSYRTNQRRTQALAEPKSQLSVA